MIMSWIRESFTMMLACVSCIGLVIEDSLLLEVHLRVYEGNIALILDISN